MKVHGEPFTPISMDLTIDGVFIKCYHIEKGRIVPQHAHKHAHVTIVDGRVKMWKGEGNPAREATGLIRIEAGVKHTFYAMEDTDLYCIHNADHALIAAENSLEFV